MLLFFFFLYIYIKLSTAHMKRVKQTMHLLPSTVCVAELDISDALKSGEGQI